MHTLWSASLRGRSSPEFLAFWACETPRRYSRLLPELQFPILMQAANTRFHSWVEWYRKDDNVFWDGNEVWRLQRCESRCHWDNHMKKNIGPGDLSGYSINVRSAKAGKPSKGNLRFSTRKTGSRMQTGSMMANEAISWEIRAGMRAFPAKNHEILQWEIYISTRVAWTRVTVSVFLRREEHFHPRWSVSWEPGFKSMWPRWSSAIRARKCLSGFV